MTEQQGLQLLEKVDQALVMFDAMGLLLAECRLAIEVVGLLLCCVVFFQIWRAR